MTIHNILNKGGDKFIHKHVPIPYQYVNEYLWLNEYSTNTLRSTYVPQGKYPSKHVGYIGRSSLPDLLSFLCFSRYWTLAMKGLVK